MLLRFLRREDAEGRRLSIQYIGVYSRRDVSKIKYSQNVNLNFFLAALEKAEFQGLRRWNVYHKSALRIVFLCTRITVKITKIAFNAGAPAPDPV